MIKDKRYEVLTHGDAVGFLKKAIDSGYLYVRDDGKFALKTTGMNHVTPWAFIKTNPKMRCHIWHHIYFNHCGFIPSYCHNCWKIVIRPANIQEAFKLYDIMFALDMNSKIGWEGRKTVYGNFGAYFYSRSLDEAQERYNEILPFIKDVKLLEHPITKQPVEPLIKRGCTEFEHARGPSDEWKMSDADEKKERLLDGVLAQDMKHHGPHDWLTSSTFREWIHNAYAVGDETVLNYTDGEMLFPPYVTYQGDKNG